MGATFSQFFPPTPSLTETNLPSQTNRVFIITGSTSGVGYALATLLYHAGGTVYIAARSESRALEKIEEIKTSPQPKNSNPTWPPPRSGQLHYLPLDLSDLSTIKPSAETFLAKEKNLDVLFNNAGLSLPPAGSLSAQNHELTLATNCLGPYLFTSLLLPALRSAAAASPVPGATRVVWTSSVAVDLSATKYGIDMPQLRGMLTEPGRHMQQNYATSKTGNYFLAAEFVRRHSPPPGAAAADRILSVTANPGNLKTELLRHTNGWMGFFVSPILYAARFGAYTELWAGLGEGVVQGGYVVPWGRMHPAMRGDLVEATGEGGVAGEFWEWCEELTEGFR